MAVDTRRKILHRRHNAMRRQLGAAPLPAKITAREYLPTAWTVLLDEVAKLRADIDRNDKEKS